MDGDALSCVWRSSTKCESASCVLVAVGADGVRVRSSADEDGPVLRFFTADWAAFVACVEALSERDQTPA